VRRLAFPTNHKDPFPRLLVAQALVEQISIVSGDWETFCAPVFINIRIRKAGPKRATFNIKRRIIL